jgi:hypothetical protein
MQENSCKEDVQIDLSSRVTGGDPSKFYFTVLNGLRNVILL